MRLPAFAASFLSFSLILLFDELSILCKPQAKEKAFALKQQDESKLPRYHLFSAKQPQLKRI
jgi:hypothetical protein